MDNDEIKSPLSHRPKANMKDFIIARHFPEIDCAYCFHPKLRHKNNIGDCNYCGFFCTRFRRYELKHTPDPNFRYWFSEFR